MLKTPWEISEAFLQTVHIGTAFPVPAGGIETCTTSDSALSALRRLTGKGILSMPVVYGASRELVGVVSLTDLMALLTGFFADRGAFAALSEAGSAEAGFRELTVGDLLRRQPHQSCAHVVPDSSNLLDVCEAMARESAHRVVTVTNASFYSGSNEMTGLVTQSAVVGFLNRHLKELGPIADQLVLHSSFYKEVITVPDRGMTALEAFRLMTMAKVSGVGVVNDSGKLVGDLSEKDLRRLLDSTAKGADFSRVAGDVSGFASPASLANLVAKPEDTVGHVIGLMAKSGAHRVYILDSHGFPIGLLSLRDVIRLCVAPPGKFKGVAKKVLAAARLMAPGK
jgi:CBS domain-containing protein